MKDHYTILGVSKNASQDEIKRAYRKLASQHHPDKGGNKEHFQEIQSAYDVIGDPQRRSEYDNPARPFGGEGFAGFQFGDIHDIFNMFGQARPQSHQRRNHVRMNLWISLRDVATGGSRTVSLSSAQGQQTVEIEVPLGLNDGDNVQYAGIGPGGQDLVVTYRIQPSQQWRRDALNLYTEHVVVIWDLVVGGDFTVRNIHGHEIIIKIPPRCQPGTSLRVRGHGLKDRAGRQGDMFVKLNAKLPDQISDELVEAIQKYRQ